MATQIPQKYTDKLIEMIKKDSYAVHLFESVNDGVLVEICGDMLSGVSVSSFADLRETGIIDSVSLPVFDVFCSAIQMRSSGKSDENSLSSEFSMKISANSSYQMCTVNALFLRDENGRVTDIHYSISAFSEKEHFERKVINMFSADKNPKWFGQRCSSVIESNPDKKIAFIQFDIDHFKMINDKYGVQTGDEILAYFNDTLELVCNSNQPFCRLTADVYMVVTPFDDREEILDLIHKIESMLCGYKGIEYKLCFGVAVVDDRNAHTRRHGDNAGIARRRIKGNALNNVMFYEEKMKSVLEKTKAIEDNMNDALLNGEFVMYLQPKYSISTGRIVGAEALARWISPKKGMISPGEFVPVFEKNGFIFKLDKYIWELACKKLRYWLDNGIDPVPISVNISREYVQSRDVVAILSKLIRDYKLPIELLELEITESYDAAGIEAVVEKLKNAGFTMLMDDFGSGYSSLNMLKSTQFDVLKIDRAFLSEFMESDRGRKIIEHTITMSQDIGLGIIAEGVETKEQALFLSKCGCDFAQGFYYSKPIPAEEFDKRLVEVNT